MYVDVESITVPKKDYERLLRLEKQEKIKNQRFLDQCAIAAMSAILVNTERNSFSFSNTVDICKKSYKIAKEMLNQRNKENENRQ